MPTWSDSTKRLRDAQRTARKLLVDGVSWLVYEVPAGALERRSAASLVFENEAVIRRVHGFPANWRSLGDQELLAVSWTV